MYWKDEGYLLSKNNYTENSIIIQAFTAEHGNYSGIVYGGASRKQKKIFQIGNKILCKCVRPLAPSRQNPSNVENP